MSIQDAAVSPTRKYTIIYGLIVLILFAGGIAVWNGVLQREPMKLASGPDASKVMNEHIIYGASGQSEIIGSNEVKYRCTNPNQVVSRLVEWTIQNPDGSRVLKGYLFCR